MAWYRVKILDSEVNWASVVASGVLFIGLELWRRRYIERKIKQDIRLALAEREADNERDVQVQQETKNLLDEILDRI